MCSQVRKYNLLLYGVPQHHTPIRSEDSEQVVRDICTGVMNIPRETMDNIGIMNCHRIPSNRGTAPKPDDDQEATRPDTIIVKFSTMKGRDKVLSSARNIPRDSKIRVHTDLPRVWKEKRAKLAAAAYKLRREEHLQTSIRESAQGVWLVSRKNKEEPWVRYQDEAP